MRLQTISAFAQGTDKPIANICRKIFFIIPVTFFPFCAYSFHHHIEKVCYKLCNAYYKLSNTCYKLCNACYKVCNKKYLTERKNSLIRAQKLSAQRVRNSLRGVVKACRMGAALSIALLPGQGIADNAAASAAAFQHFRGIYVRQTHQIATFCYKNLRERRQNHCSIT